MALRKWANQEPNSKHQFENLPKSTSQCIRLWQKVRYSWWNAGLSGFMATCLASRLTTRSFLVRYIGRVWTITWNSTGNSWSPRCAFVWAGRYLPKIIDRASRVEQTRILTILDHDLPVLFLDVWAHPRHLVVVFSVSVFCDRKYPIRRMIHHHVL